MKTRFLNNLLNVTPQNPVYRLWGVKVVEGLSPSPSAQKIWEGLGERVFITGADTFFMHYSMFPKLRRENPDPFLNTVLHAFKEYTASEAYQKARSITRLNDFLSLIFSRRFLHHLLEELSKKQEQKQQALGAGTPAFGEGQGGGAGQGGQGQEQNETTAVGQQQKTDDQAGGGQEPSGGQGGQDQADGQAAGGGIGLSASEIGEAVKAALEKAAKDAEAAKDLADAMGGGVGPGVGKTPAPLEKLLNLADKVLSVSWARDVLALAREIQTPRFVHLVKEKERRGDEVAGFRRTLRLDRALPRELALDDDLFYAKLASGGLLSREYYVTREGAYYVLIDRSGSMSGEKTVWARSVALALWKLARARGRKFYLRFFDATTHPAPERPPLSRPEEVVEYMLTATSFGGTSIDTALRTAVRDLQHLKEVTNTVIIITDGEDHVSTSPDQLKGVGARLIVVMIQGHNEGLRQLALASGGDYLHAALDPRGGGLVVKAAER